jgi:polyhydroxybutyrate depolymerase
MPQDTLAAPGVTVTSYTGCSGSAVVDLYTIDGAGHDWPGGPGQTNAVDATATIWAFFDAHSL